MTREEFANYYFGSVTIVGILHDAEVDAATLTTMDDAIGGRSLEEAVAGCYYMCVTSCDIPDPQQAQLPRPLQPRKSSLYARTALTDQNCNAGFIVPPAQRGKRIGVALAESFLYYAPRLGYRSSVFNLVYDSELETWILTDTQTTLHPCACGTSLASSASVSSPRPVA